MDLDTAYEKLADAGYPVTEDLEANARAVYDRIAYGADGDYTGEIEYGGARMTELDVSQFADPNTKNAEDLVI